MSDNGSNPRGIPRWKFIVGASGFCALISVTLSSLFWLVYFRPHSLVLAVQMFGGFWLTAFIPAGFFGCAAGLVGGAWFSTRRGRIRSTTLLLAEAATVGIAFRSRCASARVAARTAGFPSHPCPSGVLVLFAGGRLYDSNSLWHFLSKSDSRSATDATV